MGLLEGLRVVEGSAFVAAPLGGLTLAQLGADVIRFDTIGGGLDYQRWPVTDEGVSLYWAGLNKGKRSIAFDLSRPEGRELAAALITAPGDDAGVFLSNFPAQGWLADDRLRAQRADVAFTMVANLGFLAQAQVTHENRPPLGNDMYGAFGRDFPTKDGRRVMVVAISLNQWHTLVRATGVEEHLPSIARAFNADFAKEEDRYRARDAIAALMKPWFESRTLDEVRKALDEHGVCWGPYQTFTQLLDDDWRASAENPVFGNLVQPGIGSLLTPTSPLRFADVVNEPPGTAPLLGTHTDEVLEEVLGLSPA